MKINKDYADDVCKSGRGIRECRYLMQDESGHLCAKKVDHLNVLVNAKVSSGDSIALGDNCQGKGYMTEVPRIHREYVESKEL